MCMCMHEGAFVSSIIFRCLIFLGRATHPINACVSLVSLGDTCMYKPAEVFSRYNIFCCTASCLGLGKK